MGSKGFLNGLFNEHMNPINEDLPRLEDIQWDNYQEHVARYGLDGSESVADTQGFHSDPMHTDVYPGFGLHQQAEQPAQLADDPINPVYTDIIPTPSIVSSTLVLNDPGRPYFSISARRIIERIIHRVQNQGVYVNAGELTLELANYLVDRWACPSEIAELKEAITQDNGRILAREVNRRQILTGSNYNPRNPASADIEPALDPLDPALDDLTIPYQAPQTVYTDSYGAPLSPGRLSDGGRALGFHPDNEHSRLYRRAACEPCRSGKRKCVYEDDSDICTQCKTKMPECEEYGFDINLICSPMFTDEFSRYKEHRPNTHGKAVALDQGWMGRRQRRQKVEDAEKAQRQQEKQRKPKQRQTRTAWQASYSQPPQPSYTQRSPSDTPLQGSSSHPPQQPLCTQPPAPILQIQPQSQKQLSYTYPSP